MELNQRQIKVLEFINIKNQVRRKEIENYISGLFDKTSKVTILRDLEILLNNNLIKKIGSARNIKYSLKKTNDLFLEYDINSYFNTEVDDRLIKYNQFNFDIFEKLKNIFTQKEIDNLEKINNIYKSRIQDLSEALLKKEFKRLFIELSWKSSQIEGNTYSLLDTEALIKENIEAEGHLKSESIMILNHKKALEYIFNNKDYYKNLTLKKIEELHVLLTNELSIKKGLRKSPVGIVGTNYKPLFNQLQIKDAMENLIKIINNTQNIIEKALIAVLMISYIQPFDDGNKRTGRILANAILFANDYCPLSYRSVKDTEYKKAMILFYENNSIVYFKHLFTQQFEFAVNKYFS